MRNDGFSIAPIAVLQGVRKHGNRRCGLKEQGNRPGGIMSSELGLPGKDELRNKDTPTHLKLLQYSTSIVYYSLCSRLFVGSPLCSCKGHCPLLLALVTQLDTS